MVTIMDKTLQVWLPFVLACCSKEYVHFYLFDNKLLWKSILVFLWSLSELLWMVSHVPPGLCNIYLLASCRVSFILVFCLIVNVQKGAFHKRHIKKISKISLYRSFYVLGILIMSSCFWTNLHFMSKYAFFLLNCTMESSQQKRGLLLCMY